MNIIQIVICQVLVRNGEQGLLFVEWLVAFCRFIQFSEIGTYLGWFDAAIEGWCCLIFVVQPFLSRFEFCGTSLRINSRLINLNKFSHIPNTFTMLISEILDLMAIIFRRLHLRPLNFSIFCNSRRLWRQLSWPEDAVAVCAFGVRSCVISVSAL